MTVFMLSGMPGKSTNQRVTQGLACLAVLLAFSCPAKVLYVDVNSPDPVPPYSSLATAAVAIQDAVDAAANGDVILVNDGYYQTGSRPTLATGMTESYQTNRVVVCKLVTIQSIDGPSAAYISGNGIYRCVYLTNGAVLSGFTLTSGAAGYVETGLRGIQTTVAGYGGGVTGITGASGVVSNCVISYNTANDIGGGAYEVTLINCTITGNNAEYGGGAADSTLLNCLVNYNTATPVTTTGPLPKTSGGDGGGIYLGSAINCVISENNAYAGGGAWGAVNLDNCTIVDNSATSSGGISPNTIVPCFVTNSIIYFNSATEYPNYFTGGGANVSVGWSCTWPLPAGLQSGNITNPPTFVSFGSDYHLAPDSPVINAGNNDFVTNSTDLDGNPRIVGGTVDMGAYEYQAPTSVISYAWLDQYGLPTDGSADFVDTDGDGMNNWQEWIAGTDPTDPTSLLTMISTAASTDPAGVQVTWQSVNTRTYYLLRSTNLSSWTAIQSNLVGGARTGAFTDTSAASGGPYFYRVGVQ